MVAQDTTDAERAKRRTREHYRTLRRELSAGQRRAAASGLSDQVLSWLAQNDGGAGSVAAYLAVGAEPATDVLLKRLTDAGHSVLLPVCEMNFQLAWTRWIPGVELRSSTLAPVVEPAGRRETVQVMEEVGLILLPALAADINGNRLGQGGGYYDRFLASLSQVQHAPRTAAVVYEHELLAANSFPYTPLDVPVDGVLTPERWHEAVRGSV